MGAGPSSFMTSKIVGSLLVASLVVANALQWNLRIKDILRTRTASVLISEVVLFSEVKNAMVKGPG